MAKPNLHLVGRRVTEGELNELKQALGEDYRPIGEIDSPAVEAASDFDRTTFERNPGLTEYVRFALPGEWWPGVEFVYVRQIRPGMRTRQPCRPAEEEAVQ